MGRRKGSKNKVKVTNLFDTEQTSNNKKENQNISTEEPDSPDSIEKNISPTVKFGGICEACKQEYYGSGTSINLSYLSGVPYWRRRCKNVVHLCPKCAIELSKVLDNWLIENGISVNKYSEYMEVDDK